MPIPERLVAALSVALVVLTLAFRADHAAGASCSGNSHAMTLAGGGANPGSGTTATKFSFSVTYADNDGCAPDRIVVVVVGVGTYDLSYIGGGLQSGATFARTVLLPAGQWGYRFEASSGSGAGLRQAKLTKVNPAKVVVAKPAVTPTPTPIPTPVAAPVVTPVPAPRRTVAPTNQPASPQASTSPSATAGAAAPSTPVATPTTAPPTVSPSPARFGAPGPRGPDPGAPIALLKLVVSTIGTIGGLVLFAALYGRWLRPAPTIQLPPVARRRRDDRPPVSESGT